MDIVLPLLACDLDRYLRLQRPTFERHYADLATTWIIVRAEEFRTVERATAGLAGLKLLDERELVPELALAQVVRRATRRRWYVQQLLKLAAMEKVDTEFALVLDADVVAVREVSDADLVVEGRALRMQEPARTHPRWVAQAGEALRLEALDYSASVTPAVLAREAIALLARYVERCVRPRRWRVRAASLVPRLGRQLATWRGRLLGVLPWTEYQVYDTFLVRSGHFDRFHRYSMDPVLYANSVWRAADFADWCPGLCDQAPIHFFNVVQGLAGIPVEQVRARLESSGVLPRGLDPLAPHARAG